MSAITDADKKIVKGSKFKVKDYLYEMEGHGNIMTCTKVLPNGNISTADLTWQIERLGYFPGYVELVQ